MEEKTPVLIIADDVVGEALNSLVLNKRRGTLNVCAVRTPGYGERKDDYLKDIAVTVGAEMVLPEYGMRLADVTADMFGLAASVSISKSRTTIIATDLYTDKVDERVESLKKAKANLIDKKGADASYDVEKLEERIAGLAGGVARIRVGGATESELKDKKLRYEDAINSCRKAMELGILPGGGTTFVYSQRFKDEIKANMSVGTFQEDTRLHDLGVDILFEAILEPIRQLASNCGENGDIVLDEVQGKEFGYGWNAATMEYGDLFEEGVLDPTSVTVESLRHGASIASYILSVGGMVTQMQIDTDSKVDGELEEESGFEEAREDFGM
jgi:chaperonin GroEL